MKRKSKWLGSVVMALMVPFLMSGCGSSDGNGGTNGASEDTTFSWWIYSGADSSYYTEYTENPALQYTLTKTYGEENKTLDFEFWQPAAGTANDNYTTMMASGDLPDILDAVICDAPQVMYEKGYALDLTEYVTTYMPNYVELVHSNEQIYNTCVTLVDGEEHYYSLRGVFDAEEDLTWGNMYRRDWIVKYGKNPTTGEAFTGGYTDPENIDSWVDDVVFPSGETTPKYISDWEWMFEIFTIAQADLGITDSYSISMYYPGFTWNGGLLSSFGGGTNLWTQDLNGEVSFGGDSDRFRAYLECLNAWYEAGWLDKSFNERSADIFYAIDGTSVRQGKVGMWMGSMSELGGRLDADDAWTDGIYVEGCAYPINDIYGTEECKNVEPDCMFGSGLAGGGIIITPKAEGKDVAALCSYLDYFYSEEGALIKTLGLSEEQNAELTDNTLYADYNLSEGAYISNEDGTYTKAATLVNDSGNLLTAVAFQKVPGLTLVKNIDKGYEDTYKASIDSWTKYPNTGFFQGTITTDSMSTEDAKICDDLRTKILEYMTNNAFNFIKGNTDITSDEDWGVWCKSLQKYNYQKATDIYQKYVDEHPFH